MSDHPLTVRLPTRDTERIDRLVDAGSFQSRSDFIRFAVKTTMQEVVRHEAEARVVLDEPDVEEIEPGELLEGPGEVPAASDDEAGPRRAGSRRRPSGR